MSDLASSGATGWRLTQDGAIDLDPVQRVQLLDAAEIRLPDSFARNVDWTRVAKWRPA